MKKLFLMPVLLCAGMLGAQTTYVAPWQDVGSFTNSSGLDHGGQQIISDGTGNTYTVGNFEGSITFGATTLTSSGSRDIYVVKYNSSGSVVAAAKLGSSGYDEGYSIAYRDNLVFVGTNINGTGTIYKMNTSLGSVTSQSIWLGVKPRSLFAYGSGVNARIVIGGSFLDEAYFPTSGGGTIYVENGSGWIGAYDSFTAIMTTGMEFTFANNPYSSTDDNEITSIWCRNGYIYCTGYFRGQLTWESSVTKTASGVQDLFVASVWITTALSQLTYQPNIFTGGSNESTPGGAGAADPYWKECGYGICANSTAIYVTGNLYNASSPVFHGSAYTGAGAFTARINYSGSQIGALSWIRTSEDCTGATAITNSIGYAVGVDPLGNVWSTGRSRANVALKGGSNPSICVATTAGYGGYIAKWDPSGNIISAEAINQASVTNAEAEGHSLAFYECSVYTTGWTKTNFAAGNLTPEAITSTKCAMYVFEISRDAMISNDIVYCEPCASFPNVLGLSASGGTSYSWTDPMIPPVYLTGYSTATPTYTLPSCSNSGTQNYICTITNTVTGCSPSASVSVTAGSSATGVANAGADFQVCPSDVVAMGTNMPNEMTYSWSPNTYLSSTTVEQPNLTCPAGGLPLTITYTLTVTDVCGGKSYDYVTVSANPSCPHRMANPNAPSAEVFPNPSTGVFTVNLNLTEEDEVIELVVTDLAGRTVQQQTITTAGGQQYIDLSAQEKGIYLLTVTRNGVSEVHQLILE